MASGQESARQRMINLMYLVFIAMLALNMSKEVLATFGVITTDVKKSSGILEGNNADLIAAMKNSSVEDSLKWKAPYETVSLVSNAADELLAFLAKDEMKREFVMKDNKIGRVIDGEVPEMIPAFELMDKSEHFDEYLFVGQYVSPEDPGYTESGAEFVRLINNFRDKSISAIENSKTGQNDSVVKKKWDQNKRSLIKQIENSFNTDPVNVQGGVKSWLHYNFFRFPEIASITKLALMEEDVRSVVGDLLTAIKQSIEGENLNTLKAIVAGVNNYFRGDKLTGTISLGKYDPTFVANRIIINGVERDPSQVMENGQIVLEKLGESAGGEGERNLTGEIIFDRTDPETGEKVEFRIPIEQTYRVNPSLAIVSNKDMNVVYEKINNLLEVGMIGVSDTDLSVSSSAGNISKSGKGQYILSGANGKKITIKTRDKSSGNTASVEFDVLPLPPPFVKFSKKGATLRLQDLISGKLVASYNDPRLDKSLSPQVVEFKVKVGLRSLGVVRGNKFSSRVRSELQRAPKGTSIQISGIRVKSSKTARTNADNEFSLTKG